MCDRGLDRHRGDQRLVLAALALTDRALNTGAPRTCRISVTKPLPDRARLKHTDLVPVFHR